MATASSILGARETVGTRVSSIAQGPARPRPTAADACGYTQQNRPGTSEPSTTAALRENQSFRENLPLRKNQPLRENQAPSGEPATSGKLATSEEPAIEHERTWRVQADPPRATCHNARPVDRGSGTQALEAYPPSTSRRDRSSVLVASAWERTGRARARSECSTPRAEIRENVRSIFLQARSLAHLLSSDLDAHSKRSSRHVPPLQAPEDGSLVARQ